MKTTSKQKENDHSQKEQSPTVEVLGFGELTLQEIDDRLDFLFYPEYLEDNLKRAQDWVCFYQKRLEMIITRGKTATKTTHHYAVHKELVAQAQGEIARAEVDALEAKGKLEETQTKKFNLSLGRNKLA